jgi:SAM-dependent methyltransferase
LDYGKVAGMTSKYRLYGDLAAWWPLISPPADYAAEAGYFATMLRSAPLPVHDVLELGSGGGSNALHLKTSFAMTLVDLSAEMLGISRQLNPDCEHRQGDMRTLRLGRRFDAVFVHDAVDYLLTEDDLRQALDTAHVHCRPGGIAMFVPDRTTESFEAATDCGGSDSDDGRGARYLGWLWDPDPADSWVQTAYAFLLRDADQSVRVVHETHRLGLFSRYSWLRLLAEAGFEASSVTEVTADDRTPREIFVGHRIS